MGVVKRMAIIFNIIFVLFILNETIDMTWTCRKCGQNWQGSPAKFLFSICRHDLKDHWRN